MEPNSFESMKSKLNLADLSKPALVGCAAIILMVAVLAGRIVLETATAKDFDFARAEKSSEVVQDSRAADSTSVPATVFVHVSGAVRNPGLYEIETGSRVASAIEAAGGFADDAVCDSVNLARVVSDGELVVVAAVSDESARQGGDAQEAGGGSAAAGAGSSAGGGAASGRLNINTASASELESLPGIGQATAAKIVSDRAANGPFKTVEDLKRVSGIGDKKYAALADLICI